MRIDTGRLIIRKFKPEDEMALIEMASDGSLNDVFGDCTDCAEWMGKWLCEARALTEADDPGRAYLAYAVEEKATGRLIGSVGCSRYEDLGETGITYFVGGEFRGRGYAAEAAKAYAGHFLERYGARRMIATIREENIPSWKSIEQAGFRLDEKKMYRDLNDEKEELYRFYSAARNEDFS